MKRYEYYNANPDGKVVNDCVCRAIKLATGIDYEVVNNLLTLTAKAYKCDKLCVCCYHNLLEKVFMYKPRFCCNGETVGEIAKRFPNNKVLIRIDGHLTCAVHSVVEDLWDCSSELADVYWVVPN